MAPVTCSNAIPSTVIAVSANRKAKVSSRPSWRSISPSWSVSSETLRRTSANCASPASVNDPDDRNVLLGPLPLNVPTRRMCRSLVRSSGRGLGSGSVWPGSTVSGTPSESKSKAVVQSSLSKPLAAWFWSRRVIEIAAVSEMSKAAASEPVTVTSAIRRAVKRGDVWSDAVTRATASEPETVNWATSWTVSPTSLTCNANVSSVAA